ncbi:MAG TPA: phospholipase D-like domain-containing protein [Anaerolineales bacterium]
MRYCKGLYALIGITLLLQACGYPEPVSTNAPVITNTLQAAVTEPSVPELTALPQTSSTEFFSPVPFRVGLGFRAPWLELYFIDPTNPFAQREIGSVDVLVAASIIAARESVDVALRFLSLESITDALITVHRGGVPVRVVAETNNLTNRYHFSVLQAAGIPVVDDQQVGLMNNTFVVIDHNLVWTGSVDYDIPGAFRKYNVAVRISSPEVAADYTKEFEEMFTNHQFGRLVAPETPYPSVNIQGTQVEVLFSPDDFVVARLSELLSGAQQSIYFLSYAFASADLGNVIREKAAQGITVGGVLEFDQVDPALADPNPHQLEELSLFQQGGLDVRLDGGPEVMNHKIIIIDGRIVVLGSYDFTARAENDNDENVLIIHDERVAQKFMEEFQRIQSHARQ